MTKIFTQTSLLACATVLAMAASSVASASEPAACNARFAGNLALMITQAKNPKANNLSTRTFNKKKKVDSRGMSAGYSVEITIDNDGSAPTVNETVIDNYIFTADDECKNISLRFTANG